MPGYISERGATRLYFNHLVLEPGGSIGAHEQQFDEIFYVLSGCGTMHVDGELTPLAADTAVLTRAGHVHGVRQDGPEPLELIVMHGHAPVNAGSNGETA